MAKPSGLLSKIVESPTFDRFILFIIIVNGLILGLETLEGLSEATLEVLYLLDSIFLAIFTLELALKALYYRKSFFKDPWRIFDFLIVAISYLPASGPFSVVRSLRVLRTLRMVGAVSSMKRVVNGLLAAIPGLGSVGAILMIVFYVSAVMATRLFGGDFPDWFGNLGSSAYTLFQVMTLESWSMGIVRPVMERYGFAWLFFLPFILLTTFTMLNLFIAVIVNAMQAETDQAAEERALLGHDERELMLSEIRKLRKEVLALSKKMDAK